jgi:protein-S-isoprenylcysteine O-methyltransferase Ste14
VSNTPAATQPTCLSWSIMHVLPTTCTIMFFVFNVFNYERICTGYWLVYGLIYQKLWSSVFISALLFQSWRHDHVRIECWWRVARIEREEILKEGIYRWVWNFLLTNPHILAYIVLWSYSNAFDNMAEYLADTLPSSL